MACYGDCGRLAGVKVLRREGDEAVQSVGGAKWERRRVVWPVMRRVERCECLEENLCGFLFYSVGMGEQLGSGDERREKRDERREKREAKSRTEKYVQSVATWWRLSRGGYGPVLHPLLCCLGC